MKTDGGYVMTIFLPWDNLPAALKDRELSFQLWVSDTDAAGEQRFIMSWHPELGGRYRLKLSNEASPAIQSRITARYEPAEGRTSVSVLATPALSGEPVTVRQGRRLLAQAVAKCSTSKGFLPIRVGLITSSMVFFNSGGPP